MFVLSFSDGSSINDLCFQVHPSREQAPSTRVLTLISPVTLTLGHGFVFPEDSEEVIFSAAQLTESSLAEADIIEQQIAASSQPDDDVLGGGHVISIAPHMHDAGASGDIMDVDDDSTMQVHLVEASSQLEAANTAELTLVKGHDLAGDTDMTSQEAEDSMLTIPVEGK